VIPYLNTLLTARLRTLGGPMQQRKLMLLDEARSAFPTGTINEALWQYLQIPAAPPAPDADYRAAVLVDTPIGYWTLDDQSGTQARDDSPAANHGTYVGAPADVALWTPRWPAAVNGGWAVTFNYAQGRGVTIPPILAYHALSSALFSVEVWFKIPSAPLQSQTILEVRGTGPTFPALPIQILVHTAGDVQIVRRNDVQGVAVKNLSGLENNVWHHLVVTNSGGTLRYFVDGVQDATTNPEVAAPISDAVALMIGGAIDGQSASAFTGMLDEVAFYNTALGTTRVAAHYAARG
jgi:hypothetical protein